METNVVQLFLTLGAAGALLYVLKLLTDGKLHTSSEVDGLRQDKKDLLEASERAGDALAAANKQLADLLAILRTDR